MDNAGDETKEMQEQAGAKKRRGRMARSSRFRSQEQQRRVPKYPIGVASQLLGVSPQMLRRYEEAGLIEPSRQTGKNRLYSDQDMAVLEEIVDLADQGINATGIRYILQLRRQIHLLKGGSTSQERGNEQDPLPWFETPSQE
jgi:MerR family transcriptional regulator/heat shock protein HspR